MFWNLSSRKVDPLLIQQVADLIIKAANYDLEAIPQQRTRREKKQVKIAPEANLNLINRLYDPNVYCKKNEERRLQKLYKEIKQCRDFRVQNQVSKKLNKRNPSKPIFQRAQQILQKRQKRRTSKKLHMQSQDEVPSPSKVASKEKRLNLANVADFNEKQHDFQRRKSNYLNARRMQQLNHTYTQMKAKPELTTQTEQIIRQRRYAEKGVLDRFQEHTERKKYYDMMRLKRITESETPFNPSISKRSKLLATRSHSNLGQNSVFQRISRSASRQCIKRGCLENVRQNEMQAAYREYKRRQRSRTDLLNVTPTARTPMKSMSKGYLSKTNTSALSRSKVKFSHIESCNYLEQKQENQNRELKKILYGNKEAVIKFVKRLIIKERILESVE